MSHVNSPEVGQHVVVTQQIPQLKNTWTTTVTGEVIGLEQQKTGSWFVDSKAGKLWLDRLTLKKDDGEIVTLNLDQFSHIEILPVEASDQEADSEV